MTPSFDEPRYSGERRLAQASSAAPEHAEGMVVLVREGITQANDRLRPICFAGDGVHRLATLAARAACRGRRTWAV